MSDAAPADHHIVDGVDLRVLPKVSLHDHLDGGLRPRTIIELAEPLGLELPATDADALAAWFAEKSDSGSLVEYLKTFDVTTAVMQTREGLTRVAREFVEDLAEDGVVWGEVRWAPEQHLSRGLSLDEAVEAVQEGLTQGMELAAEAGHGIRVGQLVSAMRHTDRGLEIAELALRHRDNGAVGFDIAGPEAGFLRAASRTPSTCSPASASRRPCTPARPTGSSPFAARSSTATPCVSATACASPKTSRSNPKTTRQAT
ncbi:hypothetical protein GCM10025869_06030 [Homoserinibacter gongjuensis]|uniref:adenosine deaminase n=1 Tax=Homoserinibacter gongjuensis TaxID=1162968 RepID=A0ABQ6JQ81_9MICO|nr:hypothetical protein GCM10025869_06030 [Homoserinibacter gongjuensis]